MSLFRSYLAIALLILFSSCAQAGDFPAKPGEIIVDGAVFSSLPQAARQLQPGSTMLIGDGIYANAFAVNHDAVSIIGSGNVKIHSATTQGKGAIVIHGDNARVQGIECYNIKVADGNGACIRFQGKNLWVESVYFHDSEQGILTGNAGLVFIEASRFERLGARDGHSHGVYMAGGDLLHISKSEFYASKSQGNEIKSRASNTVIEDNIIASLDGVDSRLVDLPNGGKVLIRRNVMQQGVNSSNSALISWGVEGNLRSQNELLVLQNMILLDRPHNRIVQVNKKSPIAKPIVSGNTIVGPFKGDWNADGLNFRDREAAGLPPLPFLPRVLN